MNIMMNTEGNMKGLKYILGLLIIFSAATEHYTQAGDKGVLITDIGVGGTGYKLLTNYSFKESSAVDYGLMAHVGYNFHKSVGLNLEFENRNYLAGDSVEVDKILSNRIGVGAEFHMINKPKFTLSIGMLVGGFTFNYNVIDSTNTYDIKASGIYQKIGLTSRFYFGKKNAFGLFLNGGFVNNPMTYDSYEYNNEQQDYIDGILVKDHRVFSRGFYVNIGLTYNWRIKNYY